MDNKPPLRPPAMGLCQCPDHVAGRLCDAKNVAGGWCGLPRVPGTYYCERHGEKFCSAEACGQHRVPGSLYCKYHGGYVTPGVATLSGTVSGRMIEPVLTVERVKKDMENALCTARELSELTAAYWKASALPTFLTFPLGSGPVPIEFSVKRRKKMFEVLGINPKVASEDELVSAYAAGMAINNARSVLDIGHSSAVSEKLEAIREELKSRKRREIEAERKGLLEELDELKTAEEKRQDINERLAELANDLSKL